ncbi:adenine phosphoribosyltransferase [Candidatus Poribacteria bacterium]|nr:adenine phosphoribosyltransferase [Candidatus Poribacteria bacterium]
MSIKEDVYTVELCGVKRDLPLVKVAPGLRVALFNLLGDTEIVKAVGPAIAEMIPKETEVLLHPEGKGIPLVYEVSAITGIPYIVPRKTRKQWMLDPIYTDVKSITTGKPERYWLDKRELYKIEGKKVTIVDDVISTGSTLVAMEEMVSKTGGEVIARVAIFTEGDERNNVSAIAHLPLFKEDN